MPELRDLELLVSLSRHKNFSHAAADCNISQPAFSTRIRKLEEEFKLPLVRRGNSFLGFTREGEVALKWARKLLADAEGMRQEINALRNNLDGKLTLGVIPTAMPFAARVSSQLRRKHPNLSIEIHSQSTRQITRRLNDFSLDAGIMYFDDADPDITVKLYEERYVLIAPQTRASGYKTQVTWAEAAQFPLCLLTPDMRNRQLIDAVFEQVSAVPTVVMEASGFSAVLAQVVSGNAATIAPVSVAETFLALSSTVQFDLVKPVMTHTIGLSIKDQSPVLPMVQALRQAIDASL
ncbi:LysR family transcriptional regulator [Paracoccaceae bacterium]|jgi:DNA-binding transcriptional LysR family regulator|nr:LysR family transcriptional regulator [Paracoccaceae bacterium]MBT6545497.1 LysR family transcriptional regulator [Paracoccaceae bacterium]MDB3910695.1 LysR family transcriptional regulator [Paracoccaceae bacterium]HBS40400.1 LysR family transcriptional regulator [Paracoccaceae bacterium]